LNGSADGSPNIAHVAAGDANVNAIPAGQRLATLARLADTMRRVGMTQVRDRRTRLLQTNKDRCAPPLLAPAEVERIAASIARYCAERK
jgi:hypothetical protein